MLYVFSFTEFDNRRAEQVLPGGGVGTGGKGRWHEKV
jgi:hypothetical protein